MPFLFYLLCFFKKQMSDSHSTVFLVYCHAVNKNYISRNMGWIFYMTKSNSHNTNYHTVCFGNEKCTLFQKPGKLIRRNHLFVCFVYIRPPFYVHFLYLPHNIYHCFVILPFCVSYESFHLSAPPSLSFLKYFLNALCASQCTSLKNQIPHMIYAAAAI